MWQRRTRFFKSMLGASGGAGLRHSMRAFPFSCHGLALAALILLFGSLGAGNQAGAQVALTQTTNGESVLNAASPASTSEDGARIAFSATAIVTGEFFAGDSSGNLYKVNTATGAATFIGNMGTVMTDIAFSPSGSLFGVTFTDLYRIDPNTGASTLIGSLGVNDSNALEFDLNGTLFMASFGSTLLRTVDTTTGATTVVGDMGVSSSGDLAFDPSSGKLFLSARSFQDVLYLIEPSTAASTMVGDIGFVNVYGMDFYGNTLFGLTIGGYLISINTTSGAGTLVANTGVAALGASAALQPLATIVLAPVEGPFRVTGPENAECENVANLWTFCQHQTGGHRPGGGLGGADDTFAWDMNLSGGADSGKAVFAVAPGKVVRYSGIYAPGETYGAVLIEHSSENGIWWSGYLHMSNIQVVEGQQVDTSTRLGLISNVSNFRIPDHLHFVVYGGTNQPYGLISRNVQFIEREVDGGGTAKAEIISPPPGSTLSSSAVTFVWSAGSRVTQYSLWVGSTPGGQDLYSASQGTNLSVTVSGLPTDGRTLYVRLWSFINGTWEGNDYTYTAAGSGGAELTVITSSLPSAETGVAYTYNLQAQGGMPPYTWSLAGGKKNKLPQGFTLASDGTLIGAPTKAKATSFTVQAMDAAGVSATRSLSLQIVQSVKLKTKLSKGKVGTPYSATLQTRGGYRLLSSASLVVCFRPASPLIPLRGRSLVHPRLQGPLTSR